MGIFAWAGVVYFRMAEAPANAIEIDIVGKQWMWKAQHSNGRREINELHLLTGQPVKLVMASQDVIHNFDIPVFRSKQDVVPGRYTMQWFTPTKPGKYHLFCGVYCGMAHSAMDGWVYVLESQAHAKWLAQTNAGDSLVDEGAKLFHARGCSGCHSPLSTVHAPLLDGIYNKPVALSDGTVVIADEQYIHDSILLPAKQITAGYQNLMPTFQGQLNEEEVMQIIAYIKSLGDTKGSTP
jgi:cytochrome c oxidase subunit 2